MLRNCCTETDVDCDRPKKSLNVDSPSFTPISLVSSTAAPSSITSRAAAAVPFTPRAAASGKSTPQARRPEYEGKTDRHHVGTATPTPQQEDPVAFNPAQIREFTPQNYDLGTVRSAPHITTQR